jgi:hypothetical protein
MLRQLALRNFKGFARFTVRFSANSVLIGPNNAGKSTIISALRLSASAARFSQRRNPSASFQDGSRWVRGHPLTAISSEGFVSENVRHEFREVESRLELTFESGAILRIVWPVGDPEAFFWVHEPNGNNNMTAARARDLLSPIGIVPTLTPFEPDERKLEPRSIRERVETRIASRHFRNHLRDIRSGDIASYEELTSFLLSHTPEIGQLDLDDDYRDGNIWIDLYYRDQNSAVDKEIYWSGDGLQIWLQILFHLWRNRETPVLVLDEPDVFLHPDLQRRLIRLLEERAGQFIVATHAAEIASEAATGSIVWIDRNRNSAIVARDDVVLTELSDVLGTSFNLSLARTLRSRLTLFVEGEDMKVIRRLARTLGHDALEEERYLATVSLGGFSKSPSVDAFAWVRDTLVGASMPVWVLLDRDYRTPKQAADVERRFGAVNVIAHVWKRKEIENYLVEPSTVARVTGLSIDAATTSIDSAVTALRSETQSHFIAKQIEVAPRGEDPITTVERSIAEFDGAWDSPDSRLSMVPGKKLIARLNAQLQQLRSSTVSPAKLAEQMTRDEIPAEMRALLSRLNGALDQDAS